MQHKNASVEVLGQYTNTRTKIQVKCRNCNYIFYATAGSLLLGHGCPSCSHSYAKTQEEFIAELKKINPLICVHGMYKNNKTKIDVSCIKCGHKWSSIPNALLAGKGCAKCAGAMKKTQDVFLAEMAKTHPDIIVLGNYKNNRTKVHCKCAFCGFEFDSTPHSMITGGNGCRNCKKSNGEKHIELWLKNTGISYIHEYRFDNCRDVNPLPFDFYLPDNRTVIEYDGAQHFEPNDFFGGDIAFVKTQNHDKIKNDFCIKNGIKIIRIPYADFNNIEEILARELTFN